MYFNFSDENERKNKFKLLSKEKPLQEKIVNITNETKHPSIWRRMSNYISEVWQNWFGKNPDLDEESSSSSIASDEEPVHFKPRERAPLPKPDPDGFNDDGFDTVSSGDEARDEPAVWSQRSRSSSATSFSQPSSDTPDNSQGSSSGKQRGRSQSFTHGSRVEKKKVEENIAAKPYIH
jgi:hypothetical protein